MDCPVCSKTPMIVVERAAVELDWCPKCEGLWFDADELEMLTEALHLDAQIPDVMALEKADSTESARPCPRCGKSMDKVYMGDSPRILIDRCRKAHGLWFDAGELGQVVRQYAADASGPDQPVVRMLGEVLAGPDEETAGKEKSNGG